MFFGNINDEEVKKFHRSEGVNCFLSELPTGDTGLLSVAGKVVPLFYYDRIINPYEDVLVLDDKAIITQDISSNGFLKFDSSLQVGNGFHVIWSVDIIGAEYYLNVNLYPHYSTFGLSNKTVSFAHIVSDVVVNEGTVVSDDYGNVLVPLTCVDGTVTLTVDGVSESFGLERLDVLTLDVVGDSFLNTEYDGYLSVSNGSVFWGDTDVESLNGTVQLNHTYTDGLEGHTVNITGVTSLGEWCFGGCTGLTSIVIPDEISLGEGCFNECTNLTDVRLPDTLTNLPNSCFNSCTGLTNIVIPDNVTSLSDDCFNSCTGLTSIVIPNSVTSLGEWCFSECTGLTSIVIPNSVTSLGDDCFHGCTTLSSITFKSTTPPTIGQNCFQYCRNLTTIKVPTGTTTAYKAILGDQYIYIEED